MSSARPISLSDCPCFHRLQSSPRSPAESPRRRRSPIIAAFQPFTLLHRTVECAVLFFTYYGYVHFGGWRGSAAVGLFLWELLTSQLYRPRSRWCVFGVLQAVLILFWFKYAGFFALAWNDIAPATALRLHHIPRVWLPLGISFFTFEFIHFAADSYQGKVERRPYGTYAAFIFFFPTMVAGPIKRYGEFEPELEHARYDSSLFARGITRILAGLAKKEVLADTFSLWSDKLNTDALHSAPPFTVACWIVAYPRRTAAARVRAPQTGATFAATMAESASPTFAESVPRSSSRACFLGGT